MSKNSAIKYMLIGAGIAGATCAVAGKCLVDIYLSSKHLSKQHEGTELLSAENAETLNHSEEVYLGKAFYRSTPHVKISITNRSGEHIHSIFYKNPSGSNVFVIFCHGYGSAAKDNAHMAMHYYKMGYNVLMPHMRAHCGSSHKYCTMGWLERLDIIDWINFITTTNKDCRIVLHGLSMGGAMVMMVTGEELPQSVACAIEDCGYTSVYDEYKAQVRKVAHLPPFPALNIFRAAAKIIAGFDIKEASATVQVRKSKTPTLFIHGSADDFVPFRMLDEVYENAACEKEKLVFEGADHATSSIMFPERYWNCVEEFIKKYI